MRLYQGISFMICLGVTLGCSNSGPSGTSIDSTQKEMTKSSAMPIGVATATPLEELLKQLPKDRWPKKADSLQWSLAERWFEQNLVDKRARLAMASQESDPFFSLASAGKVDVLLSGNVPPFTLYDGTFSPSVETPGCGGAVGTCKLQLFGLSRTEAEKLRALPHSYPLVIECSLVSVTRPWWGTDADLLIAVDRVSFKTLGERNSRSTRCPTVAWGASVGPDLIFSFRAKRQPNLKLSDTRQRKLDKFADECISSFAGRCPTLPCVYLSSRVTHQLDGPAMIGGGRVVMAGDARIDKKSQAAILT